VKSGYYKEYSRSNEDGFDEQASRKSVGMDSQAFRNRMGQQSHHVNISL
jgi:hypothetical protein